MALSSTPAGAALAKPLAGKTPSAPLWILSLYLLGLVLVYIGERVLSGLEKGAGFVTLLGLSFVLGSTALRFSPRFRGGGERKSIESLLAFLSVLGLVGLAIYFATSDFGATRLGLEQWPVERRTRFEEITRVVWASLVTLSVLPMVFAETALRPMRNAERPESRRVRSAAGAGLTLALAAIYGSLLVYAAGGVTWKADYSYFKTSRPSDSTRQLVRSLGGDPIRVVAFFPDVNEVRAEVQSYLREVAEGAPKLKVEVQDRLLAPKLAKELRATQDGVIVLSRGAATQTLTIGTELEQARARLKTLDRDFQEQVLKIARSRKTAYLSVGHGELNDVARSRTDSSGRSAQVVRTLLQKQNFVVKDLGLGQGLANEVPEDADVVLVLGPTVAWSREELAALGRYADRGGKLILAFDADAISSQDPMVALAPPPVGAGGAAAEKPAAPQAAGRGGGSASAEVDSASSAASAAVYEGLAKVVGLKFKADVLANEKQHVRVRYNDSDRTRLVSNSFSSHASVSTLSRNAPRAAVVLFGTGSLSAVEGTTAKVDFAVRSMSGTFQDTNRNYTQDKDSEKADIFNLAAAVSRPVAGAAAAKPKTVKPTSDGKDKKVGPAEDKPEPAELRAFVLGDADALSDFVMGEVVGNQILFVDALRWLVGDESVQGLPNTEEDVRIEHTKQGDLGWFYASIFGVPSLVLGVGLLVSRRSRGVGGKR